MSELPVGWGSTPSSRLHTLIECKSVLNFNPFENFEHFTSDPPVILG